MILPATSRVLLGTVAAVLIAGFARRGGALTGSGALAAAVLGATTVAAGWHWAALLIAFFASSEFWSRHGRARKPPGVAAATEKPGPRDATQVMANGAVFAGLALAYLAVPHAAIGAAALGSLATATADTWATEIGALSARPPRSIVGWRLVPAGASGGVTSLGTGAGLAGALLIAGLGAALGLPSAVALVAVAGGTTGMLVDSMIGATKQAQYWCDHCAAPTERLTHPCGATARPLRGWRWLRNDGVNAAATLAGAATAGLLALAVGAA